MSTRSTIAVTLADGKIRQVYCHWDGYLEYNGKILQEFYNSQDRAELVTSLGDISSLAPVFEAPEGHTFENAVDGVSVLYGRDRGEDNVGYELFADFNEYQIEAHFQEYNYLWQDGEWLVEDGSKQFKPLAPALAKLKEEV